MKLSIETTESELRTKQLALIKALDGVLGPLIPEISELLSKAGVEVGDSRHPVIRELQKRTRRVYEQQLRDMSQSILQVLASKK